MSAVDAARPLARPPVELPIEGGRNRGESASEIRSPATMPHRRPPRESGPSRSRSRCKGHRSDTRRRPSRRSPWPECPRVRGDWSRRTPHTQQNRQADPETERIGTKRHLRRLGQLDGRSQWIVATDETRIKHGQTSSLLAHACPSNPCSIRVFIRGYITECLQQTIRIMLDSKLPREFYACRPFSPGSAGPR